jgi:hypothetical protein
VDEDTSRPLLEVAGRARQAVRDRVGDRERFTGWIAGLGTASGHRVVVGHWPSSPYGVVTDAMVQDPAGHRALYAPTRQLAEFLAATYRFDQVQVAPCRAWRSGRRWRVQAGPLRLTFTVGRRPPLGWLLWAMPAPLARATWWMSLLDVPARRLLPGVRTRARTRDGRRQWYGARDLHRILTAHATLHGRELGALGAVHPPVGFGVGSVPSRPSLVHLTTTIETARPPSPGRGWRERVRGSRGSSIRHHPGGAMAFQTTEVQRKLRGSLTGSRD